MFIWNQHAGVCRPSCDQRTWSISYESNRIYNLNMLFDFITFWCIDLSNTISWYDKKASLSFSLWALVAPNMSGYFLKYLFQMKLMLFVSWKSHGAWAVSLYVFVSSIRALGCSYILLEVALVLLVLQTIQKWNKNHVARLNCNMQTIFQLGLKKAQRDLDHVTVIKPHCHPVTSVWVVQHKPSVFWWF